MARSSISSQPLRFYSRKQKRDKRTTKESSKDELTNKDARALQRLKAEHASTEKRLMAEAEEERRENMDAAMADLEPLTTQQRTELQAEVKRLKQGGPLSTKDKQRLAELDGVLQLDTSRQARQQQHMQQVTSNNTSNSSSSSQEPDDYTGFGDTPINLSQAADPQYKKIKAQYEAEAADRQRSRKKRPNRKPFNPLPATYQMDDNSDIPTEVQMDRAEWDEVAEEDQALVCSYMGLQRLRRNEQKLTRILQMSKPSRTDLLLLLNEVDALEGKDRRFMERYVGSKLGWEELEEQLEIVYDWNMREESEFPEFIGDSDRVDKARELRVEQQGDGGSEQPTRLDKPKVNAAGMNVMEEIQIQNEMKRLEVAEHRRRVAANNGEPVMTREDQNNQQLYEQWERMKDRQEAEDPMEPVEPRGALLRDEQHDHDIDNLTALNPALYEIDYEDDEYQEPVDQFEDNLEIDLMMDADNRLRDAKAKADKRTDAQLAKERKERADQIRELAKDETVQAVFGKDGLELLLKDKLTAEDEQRMRAAVAADEKELDTMRSLTSLWRVKQEMVAEWRALVKQTGGKWDERTVHEFMEDDDDPFENSCRFEDDTLAELDEIEQREYKRAIQAVRKQKRWLADQIKRVGEERVQQAVKDGILRLKTHAALHAAMADMLEEKIVRGQDEAKQLDDALDSELEGLDTQLGNMFGVRTEDVKKLRDGQQVDESKLFLSKEERAKRDEEARPALYRQIEEDFNNGMKLWLSRDLLGEAEAAEKEGDTVAAKKLRLMHARRAEYDSKKGKRQSSLTGDKLREKGKMLQGEGGVRTVQHALYGRVSVEETEVNRKLIARGDAHNPRFMDEVDEDDEFDSRSLALKARAAVAAAAGGDDAERKDPDQLAAEWQAMSEEQRAAISDAVEKEDRDANAQFDTFVLSQVPLKLHYKAVREWHKLSDVDKRRLIEQGRENRQELRYWMWERMQSYGEQGEAIDPLSQYWIDESDPKLHGAVEGAFWHVGRWELDERTDEEKRASNSKRIVRRHAPVTPDTQTLLDEAEMKLFPVEEPGEEDEEIDLTRDVDIDVEEDATQDGGSEPSEASGGAATNRPKLGASTAIDAGGSVEDEADVSELTELFNRDPEAADDFDTLDEYGEHPDDDVIISARRGSEQNKDEDEDAVTAGGDEEDEVLTVREKDGYIEYYDDGETIHDEEDETTSAAEMEEDEDEDDEEDVEVERDPSNDLDDDTFNPRLLRHRHERDERRQRFQDLDPVPTGDQRAFDDQYFHYDEDEYELMTKLDPYGEEDDYYRKPQSQETVWNEYSQMEEKGQQVLTEETRQALYLLHQSQPSVWTPAALATKFRMSHQHVKGILMIEAADQRMKDHGLEEEDSELYQSEEDEDADTIEDYKSMTEQIKFRQSLIRRGDDGEMIELIEREDTNDVLPERMLHYLPRLPHPRVPDVRFVNENDLAAVLEEEREVEERFMSQQAKLAKRESEHFARQGPIGATSAPKYSRKADPDDNYQQPAVLKGGKLLPPIPHHLVMVDISERRQDRYSMAVRDVTGWLRLPTPIEFVNTRRRERSAKARFVNVQYRQENNTPI